MPINLGGKERPIAEREDLISVFDTIDEAEALVVQGLLESNEIETLLVNLDAPRDVLPGVGGIVIRVRPQDAAEARDIIASQRNALADEPESSESEDL